VSTHCLFDDSNRYPSATFREFFATLVAKAAPAAINMITAGRRTFFNFFMVKED